MLCHCRLVCSCTHMRLNLYADWKKECFHYKLLQVHQIHIYVMFFYCRPWYSHSPVASPVYHSTSSLYSVILVWFVSLATQIITLSEHIHNRSYLTFFNNIIKKNMSDYCEAVYKNWPSGSIWYGYETKCKIVIGVFKHIFWINKNNRYAWVHKTFM